MKNSKFILLSYAISILAISCSSEITGTNPEELSINKSNVIQSTNNSKQAITGNGVLDLPKSGIKDGFYIVSKRSNRAITKVSEGVQLVQTELCDSQLPSSSADLTINYTGNVLINNTSYKTYKIQWGSLNPYSLSNKFWDIYNNSSSNNTPVISWPSVNHDNQKFVFEETGDADGSVYIKNVGTGSYLQIAGGSDVNTSSGAVLETYTLTKNSNQKFFIKTR